MRMFQRSPSGLSMILENQDVLESPVLLQVEDTITEGPQNIFNTFRRQRRKAGTVIGRLDDHLMGPDAVHAIKHAFSLPVQGSLNSKRGKLVRNYAHRPPRRIFLRRRSSIRIRTISLNLRRDRKST